MANSETEGFLRAEAEVNELLDQVKALKDEIVSYSEARSALEAVTENIFEAAGSLEDLTTAVGRMVKAASAAGIPGLIESVNELATRVEDWNESAQEGSALLVSKVSDQRNEIGKLAVEVGSMKEQEESARALLTNRLGGVEARIATLRMVIFANAAILVIGLGVVIALLLGR